MSRQRLVIVLTALLGAGLLSTAPGGAALAGKSPAGVDGCPAGFERAGGYVPTGDSFADRLRAATRTTDADGVACVRVNRPESAHELSRLNAEMAARRLGGRGGVRQGAFAAALAERHALAAAGSAVAGTGGTWEPMGNTPLIANDPAYGSVNGEGLVNLAGRIQDFAYDEGHDVLYVAVAQGGVYKTTNRGDTWVSVSDTLPNLTVGSVAFSTANGGTLVVVTGDSNGGGNSVVGTGVYWSDDDGASWHHASGVPDGLLGFRVAVDPTNPMEFYAATGGLFRSTNASKSFVNVALPTGDCAGQPAAHPCFFANHVTDVVVQAPDDFGNTGGRVVAAVGWRAGAWRDISDEPQSPNNGLYASDSGEPGSFTKLTAAGFAVQDRIGRIELGAAVGSGQNHDFLYALVQDAVKFNGGVPVTDANEVTAPVIGYNTALEGIYVSNDFGDTWVRMQDGEALAQAAAAEGSALGGTAQATAYAPGVQSWYNMWIKPDPTRTDTATHAPTRLLFGLEEVWQNEVVGQPMVGPSGFKVIGRYFAGETCFFLGVPALPYCPPYRGEPQGGTTTHPDQHGAIFLPGPEEGGVTLLVGNDGGVYRQVAGPTADFANSNWGDGRNDGFHTLMPYSVAVGPDGTIWAGLQDNGHMKITADGKQYMTFGGDGTWAAVDPEDSEIAYEATPGGAMRATSDGGSNWSSIDPGLTGAAFVNQFKLDPLDPAHLVTAGREVVENINAPSNSWTKVYDLGTVDNPGQTPADTDMSVPNRMSAIDVLGETMYVGWCGICDVVTQVGTFKRGLATNVGGDWHEAAAEGLPARYITNVTIDPDDESTIYVVLSGYGRRWVPPGENGDPAEDVGEGHVFKSTNGGESFVDISGSLPDISTNWLEIRGDQLLVATDFGVFASPSRAGQTWALLGAEFDLPMAPVWHISFRPNDPNHLYAATYGRGIYRYRFSDAAVQPPVVQPSTSPPPPVTQPRRIAATGTSPALPALGGLALLLALLATRALRTRLR